MEGKDNIYIDDAIDALMAAMQFRTIQTPFSASTKNSKTSYSKALVVNVGMGKGSTLGDIAEMMEGYSPRSIKNAHTSYNYQNQIVAMILRSRLPPRYRQKYTRRCQTNHSRSGHRILRNFP